VNKKRKNYSYIANIPSAAFVANKNGDIIETNSVFQRLFPNVTDVRFGETDLKGPYKWIHPKDFDNLVDFARAARNLRFGCLETTIRVLQNSDQWSWIQVKLAPIIPARDSAFTFKTAIQASEEHLIGLCEDVSLQKAALLALRDRESRSRKLLSGIRDAAIFILNEQGYIQFCNDAIKHVLGFNENELVGKHISEICPKTEIISGKSIEILEKVDREGVFEEVSRKLKKDGSGFWAQILVSNMIGDQPSSHRYCFVVRDVTRYKHEEKELHEWKKRFEQLAENVKEAFWIYDIRAAQMVYVSPIFGQLLNDKCLTQENFFNTVLKRVHQRDLLIARSFMSDLTLGQDANVEFRTSDDDGQIRWLSMRSFAVRDHFQRVHRIVGVTEDITEKKESDHALHQAKENADSANRAKTEFLANMSHEIRTPLGAILGFAELMADKLNSDEDRASALSAILRNGKQLSKIIDEILDLSKVEAGRTELDLEEFELMVFIEDVTSFLELQAREKAVKLKVEPIGDLPQFVRSDPTKLRQILFNVIGNAIKFTERGMITIQFRVVPNNRYSTLKIEISDTGQGLSADQQDRIFHPFVQADSSTSRKFGGTGLGLVLSRKFAQLLGGDLKLLWSTPNVGSCFEITIDLGLSDELKLVKFKAHKPWKKSFTESEDLSVRIKGLKTLVIDDAFDNRLIVERFLSRAGASVEHAENGVIGAKMVLQRNYDAIIMDIQMPEFDGYQTIKYLRSQGVQTPVIALSAHAMKEDRERSIAAGFNEHLSKPINRAQLIKTVAYMTAQRG
jgi:PAS domain S-box-containing protein